MKTIDDHFSDWESHVFGYGYGTGEEPVLRALIQFFGACDGFKYDYIELEAALTAPVAWLLINALCHADIIEYGTSPRFGWMTNDHGRALARFVRTHSFDEMVRLTNRDEEYIECYPDHCNCDDGPCENPFWRSRP
jgi:hypothetical protein